MFCPKCGTENDNGNVFCIKCGNKLIVDTTHESVSNEKTESKIAGRMYKGFFLNNLSVVVMVFSLLIVEIASIMQEAEFAKKNVGEGINIGGGETSFILSLISFVIFVAIFILGLAIYKNKLSMKMQKAALAYLIAAIFNLIIFTAGNPVFIVCGMGIFYWPPYIMQIVAGIMFFGAIKEKSHD